MDIIKKIFAILSNLPAFTSLFQKATQTGKIDPMETLNVLSSISPGTKKITDTAINTAQQSGNISDVAKAITNVGEIDVFGQKVNTRTMTQDLKKAGGICSVLANMLESMQKQSPQEIVDFGEKASDVRNWQGIINQ